MNISTIKCPVCNKVIPDIDSIEGYWCLHVVGTYNVYYDYDETMLVRKTPPMKDQLNEAWFHKHIAFEDEAHIERLLMLL